jgi:hypothetical protein
MLEERGEAHIKNLISMGVYIIGVLALLSAFFYSESDRTTHGPLLLMLGTLGRGDQVFGWCVQMKCCRDP